MDYAAAVDAPPAGAPAGEDQRTLPRSLTRTNSLPEVVDLVRVAAAFGEPLAAKLRDVSWQVRVEGIEGVAQRIRTEASNDDGSGASGAVPANQLLAAVLDALAPALSDKLVPVYLSALTATRVLFLEVDLALAPSVLRPALGRLLPKLVQRAASQSNGHVRIETFGLLRALAQDSRIGAPAVLPAALDQVSGKSDRVVAGRLDLLKEMVKEFGTGPHSGLPTAAVFQFALPYTDTARSELSQATGKGVRASALALIHALHETDSRLVETLARQRKPELLKTLDREGDDLLREASVLTGSVPSRLEEGQFLPPKHARKSLKGGVDFELVTVAGQGAQALAKKGSQRSVLAPMHGQQAQQGADDVVLAGSPLFAPSPQLPPTRKLSSQHKAGNKYLAESMLVEGEVY